MAFLCRDCLASEPGPGRNSCSFCGGGRTIVHGELDRLTIAHLDCDAFYAAIEKRDDPALANRPVIVGGGRRGVVMTACYLARRDGIHSAMPMFRALALCPDAVVIHPNMAKYGAVGRQVKAMMRDVTPLVESVSVDEAFLDLTGTEALHRGSAARTLAGLARRIEDEIGISVSIGLSHNKFLAKLASDLDKPRGFSVIGRAETLNFLTNRPVGDLWGVGKVLKTRLEADGVFRIGDLRRSSEDQLKGRYGAIGSQLYRFAWGEDHRPVLAGSGAKSLSAETTFADDIADLQALKAKLWRLSEKVSARIKNAEIAGSVVTLKLKTSDFRLRTRRVSLSDPTQLAEVIYRAGVRLLEQETGATRFRLIGIGVSDLAPASAADPPDLADPAALQRKTVEHTMDRIRDRFGAAAIAKGRQMAAHDGDK